MFTFKVLSPHYSLEMRKSNYSFEKRQRDIAKQKKREAKRLRRPDKADQSDRVETSNDLV